MSRSKDHITSLGLSVREWLIAVILTFPVFGTLFPVGSYLSSAADEIGREAPQTQDATVVLALILLYVIWLLAREPQKTLQSFRRNFIIFVFLFWAFLTSQWSYDPGLSFNRTGRMLVFALYAIYIVDFIPIEKTRKLLLLSLGLSCVISMMFIIGVPSLARMLDDRGSWRGAMMHKNNLGSIAGMMLIFSLLHWRLKLLDWRLGVLSVCLSAVLLHLSNNAGSLVSVFIIMGLMWYVTEFACRTRYPLVALFVGCILFGTVGFALSRSDFIFDLLGRDRSLTGRDAVGQFAQMMIDQKPFWGYGMGAWSSVDFRKLAVEVLLWPAPHAHNSWLDFRLQLGIPGLVIAIIMWIIPSVALIRLISRKKINPVVFPASILVFIGIRSYSETILVDPGLNEMFWFAFACAAMTRATAASSAFSRSQTRRRLPQAQRFGGDVVATN